MIYGTNAPKECWGEAIVAAAYLKNRWPTSALTHLTTPEEAWSGTKPSVEHIRPYGTPCHVHIPAMNRLKFDAKSWEGKLMGFSETSKAYRVWDPKRRTVIVARDVVIREGSLPVDKNNPTGKE